jgi:hypothetical protein
MFYFDTLEKAKLNSGKKTTERDDYVAQTNDSG